MLRRSRVFRNNFIKERKQPCVTFIRCLNGGDTHNQFSKFLVIHFT